MNYKLIFPTYRTRYRFVKLALEELASRRSFNNGLNLGCGEGDYDPMISSFCKEMISCDINEEDISFARELNSGIENIEYKVENAIDLSFPDNSFDLIVSTEVIEHVGNSPKMIEEIQRVLKPGGVAIMTFPSVDFPFTYDPINRILSFFKTNISYGAYAFGHDYLISKKDFRDWATNNDLSVMREQNLGGYFVGLTEMYWVGLVQKIVKPNSNNLQSSEKKSKLLQIRPSSKEPFLTIFTDALIKLDFFLFKNVDASCCKGFILKKEDQLKKKNYGEKAEYTTG